MYPGVYWNDTTSQILNYLNPGALGDHHPFMDTIIIGGFAQLGDTLFHDYFLGTYALILLQALCMAMCLGAAACYPSRPGSRSGGYRRRFALTAFFALFPFFPVMFSGLAKDTLSAPLFLCFCLMHIDIIRSRGARLRSRRFVTLLALIGVGCCLTKKTGLILVVLSLLLLMFMGIGRRLRTVLATVAVLIVLVAHVAVPAAVGAIRPITPGGKQEILAVPLQQVANVVRKDPSALSQEDRDIIARTYPMAIDKIASAYKYQAADGVKRYAQPPTADYSEFLRPWLRLAIEKPVLYTEAWLGLSGAWFSFQGARTLQPPLTSWNHARQIERLRGWDAETLTGGKLEKLYDSAMSIPVLDSLFSGSLYASVLPTFLLFIVLCSKRGKRNTLLLLAPIGLTVLSLLTGPTSATQESIRYLTPLAFLVPLYCAILLPLGIRRMPESQ